MRTIKAGAGRRTQESWSRWQQSVDAPLEAELEASDLAGPLPTRLNIVERDGNRVRIRTRNRLALMRWLCAAPGWHLVGPQSLRDELSKRLKRLDL